MQLTQATLALVLAAVGASAIPAPAAPRGGDSTCNGGDAVNYCANKGIWSKQTTQECEAVGGSPSCCSSGDGVNVLTCTDVGDIDLGLLERRQRRAGGKGGRGGRGGPRRQPPPVYACNGGDAVNYCVNQGKWAKKTTQDCDAEGGSPTCCTSGDGLNVLTCSTVGDVTVSLRKRDEPEPQPQGDSTCNGGDAVNVCENKGIWSKKTEQACDAEGGSPFCCSSGDGLNIGSCTNAGDITVSGLGSLLVKRDGSETKQFSGKPGGQTCNGGDAVNACQNSGKWSKKTEQECTAEGGSPYCCSSGDGINVLTCTSTGDITIDLGLGETIGELI